MGELLGSFLESMRVRTKNSKKTCVGLWGQPVILKVVWGIIVTLIYVLIHFFHSVVVFTVLDNEDVRLQWVTTL